MSWFLPIALVLFVALIVATIHFFFMRWMARSPPAVSVCESDESRLKEQQR
jgi:hypothetical protein